MPIYELSPHPDHPPLAVRGLQAQLYRQTGSGMNLIYSVDVSVDCLKIPRPAKPYRTDGLWKTTCFELFIRGGGEDYMEFNFAPSGEWAAYLFRFYRDDVRPLAIDEVDLLSHPPAQWTEHGEHVLGFHMGVGLGDAQDNVEFGLSAVIEETDGTKSYWALVHPPGPPDFHHPTCFAARLPAVGEL